MLRRAFVAVANQESDTTRPTCVITCDITSPTIAATINYTITFSEVVTGFEVGDFAVTNGTKGALGGGGAVYTCAVTPTTAGTPVTANVAANVAQDAAGNLNTAATQLSVDYYSAMFYVRKSGNDTTGNGSSATPWLTLNKAITSVGVGAGHLIRIGDGVYAENTSGSNQLQINKAPASWLTIEPESGSGGAVTITGNGAAIDTYYPPGATINNIKFRYLTFGSAAGRTNTRMHTSATVGTLYYDHCTFSGGDIGFFNGLPISVTFNVCTWIGVASGISASPAGLTLINCALTATNYTVDFSTTTVGHTCSITGGSITSTSTGAVNAVRVNGGTVTISNLNITHAGAANAVVGGVDGTSGNATILTLNTVTVNKDASKTGHVVIWGAGCSGGGANGLTVPQAYDYAVVIKENANVELQNFNLTGGVNGAAVYLKAANAANVHNGTAISVNGGQCFKVGVGDTGNKCQNWQYQHNINNVTGTGKTLNIGGASADAGGGICDNNQYKNNSGLGVVRADTDVQNLTELQAAWSGYGDGSNDSHSTVV